MIRANYLLFDGNGDDKFIYPLQKIHENAKRKTEIAL